MMIAERRHHHKVELLFLLLVSVSAVTGAFELPRGSSFLGDGRAALAHYNYHIPKSSRTPIRQRGARIDGDGGGGSTQLQCALLPSVVTKISSIGLAPPLLRNSIVLGSAAALLYKNRNKFRPPNLPTPDASFAEPLPDGSLGCPYLGNIKFFSKIGDAKTGSGAFYRMQSSLSSNPRIFKYAPLGKPSVIIAGMSNVKKVFNKEFKLVKTGIISEGFGDIFGGERLDLKDDEIDTFYRAVNDWIGGILNPATSIFPKLTKYRKVGKAFAYLISKIDDKLDSLERNGPDGSTMSGMYFAKDEEDPSKCLDRSEIISNTLLLILAGSETAASTLTCAMLALGLQKDALKKLRDEQFDMMSKHQGEDITRDMLEKDCPYLDAFVKEVMRIKPLATTGAMRFAQETFVVEGKQVPKGYGVAFNPYLTHLLDPALKEEDGSHMDISKGFKPERWLDDDTKPTEYMPFGIGPRYCLGVNLALAEMKVFLALFARRVDFNMTNTTPENVEWKRISIIPKPKDGALVSILSVSNPSSTVVQSTVSV